MKKTLIGIVATTLTLYVWGFLYWGVNTLPYQSWQQTADDQLVQDMLTRHFPESGTYFIPGIGNEPAMREALYSNGPTGFIHIKHGGSSEADPNVMLAGFLLNLVVVSLMAFFFRVAGAAEFRQFVALSASAGAVAVIAMDVGDMIWWQIPADWKIWQLIYNYSLWLLTGLMLGIFMRPDASR